MHWNSLQYQTNKTPTTQVIKCTPSVQSRDGSRRKPPQPTDKPRVLCVTIQRRVGGRGFKATLHICKGSPGIYEVRKSLRLRVIAKLEAFRPPVASQPLFEIAVVQRAFTGGDARYAFEASSDAARGEIIGLLYSFCRSHEKMAPEVKGVSRGEMGAYRDVLDDEDAENAEEMGLGAEKNANAHSDDGRQLGDGDDDGIDGTPPRNKQGEGDGEGSSIRTTTTPATPPPPFSTPSSTSSPTPLTSTSSLTKQQLMKKKKSSSVPFMPRISSEDLDASTSPTPLVSNRRQQQQRSSTLNLSVAETDLDAAWSARQDAQLSGLLDAVAGGATSLGDARERLETELNALIGANVHELLESAAAADVIESEIGTTLGFVDDLEETLQMFDAKLRHMRDDMSVIEAWTGRLESRSKSNVRLLNTLEGVAAVLMLSPETEGVLKNQEAFFTSGSGSGSGRSLQSSDSLIVLAKAGWDLYHHMQILNATPSSASSTINTATTTTTATHGTGRSSMATATTARNAKMPLYVPPLLQQLNAVIARKKEMQAMVDAFVRRASSFLSTEYSRIADPIVSAISALGAGERLSLSPPPHAGVHARAAQLRPLLDVVAAMSPGAERSLQLAYCNAVNGLLRKEIHGAVKELMLLPTGGGGGSGGTTITSSKLFSVGAEPDMGLHHRSTVGDTVKTLERIMSTPASAGGGTTSRERNSDTGGESSLRATIQRAKSAHHHRRGSSLGGAKDSSSSGVGGGVGGKDDRPPMDESFESILNAYIPILIQEIERCMELVCCSNGHVGATSTTTDGGGSGGGAVIATTTTTTATATIVSALLASIPEIFFSIIDRLRPPRVLPCLGMVGCCLYWQGKLRRTTQGGSTAATATATAHVVHVLRECELKLRTVWDTYVSETSNAIRQYDGTSAMSGHSARNIHVLPFIVNFEAVATRIEASVSYWDDRDLVANSNAREAVNIHPPTTTTEDGLRPSPFESSSTTSATTPPTQTTQTTLPSPSVATRSMADAFYTQIIDAALVSIETHASQDSKHGPRVRLENYAFLRLSLQSLPASPSGSGSGAAAASVLTQRCAEAAQLRNTALSVCVDQQLESVLKLDRLVGLGLQLATLASQGVGPAEVAGHVQWSSADARQAVSTAAAGLDKRLGEARKSLHKNLDGSSPYLVDVIWDRLMERCVGAWGELELRMPAVWPGVGVVPTAEGLRTAFLAAKAVEHGR